MTAQNIAQRGREKERDRDASSPTKLPCVSRAWLKASILWCGFTLQRRWWDNMICTYCTWIRQLGFTWANKQHIHTYYLIMVSVRHVYVSILAREARVLFLVFILFAYLKVFLFVQVRLASCNWGVHIHVIRLNSKLKPITVNNDVKSHGRYMDMKMSAFEMQMRV